MRQAALKFIYSVIVLTIICALAEIGWNRQMAPPWQLHGSGFTLLGIFAISVVGIHLFLLNQAKGSPQAFIRGYMTSTVLKFMLYLLILIIFLLYSTENKQSLILHFLFFYVVFTALEVSALYKEIGRKE